MGCDVRGSWSQWAEGCIPPLADDGEDRQRSKGALTKANFQIEKKTILPDHIGTNVPETIRLVSYRME